MNKSNNKENTETRELRNQPKGGARGTSGLRVGDNPKATGASGPSLKSQGEATTKITGNNKVIYLIVTLIISMKLRNILFFTGNKNNSLYPLNKEYNKYLNSSTLNHILMYHYYETFTYPTSTLSIFKTIKIEISLCSNRPDRTLLIKYASNILVNIHLYDYPIVVKRLLTINVPILKQIICFITYHTETKKCCKAPFSKTASRKTTTYVPSVYFTRNIIIKLYQSEIILVIKQHYVNKYAGLLDNNFFIKKCTKFESNSTLFQGAKRKGQDSEEPKARRRRAAAQDLGMNYAELSKTHTMLEARSSDPETPLDQTDFEHLDSSLIFFHLDNKPTPEYGIVKMGLSQGGVWIACKDKGTVDFVTAQVPKIDPPETKTHTGYEIYGPDNRPYKYYKIRVPARFWHTPERFIDLIKHFNKELDYSYLAGNFYKQAHLRVSSGLKDRTTEIEQGFFVVTLEVEENMEAKIVEKNGIIMIGPNALEIKGGRIEKAIEEYEKKKQEQTTEDMELAGGEEILNYSA